MKKSTVIVICLIAFAAGSVYGNAGLEDKLKSLKRQRDQKHATVLDDKSLKEIERFVMTNENVPVKDVKRFRLVGFACGLLLEEMNKKYAVNENTYQARIKDEEVKKLYRTASKSWQKWNMREFYACKNDNENAALESKRKVDDIRSSIASLLKQHTKDQDSNEIIALKEEILKECKFERASLSLLTTYRVRVWGAGLTMS